MAAKLASDRMAVYNGATGADAPDIFRIRIRARHTAMALDYSHAKYLPVSWEQLHRDSRLLAAQLMDLAPFELVVPVTRGGLVPAAIVARELEIRLIDTICVASYDERRQEEAPQVLKCPDTDGTGVLVIDDLVDSGKTGRIVREMMPRAHIATVYAKPLGRDIVDTCVVEVEQDVWLLFPWDAEMQPSQPLARRGPG